MARKRVEDAIQRELVKWLHLQELEVVHVMNEREWKGAGQVKAAVMGGYTPGFPDLIIFKQVRTITHLLHLELKTKDGNLNKNQIKWHAAFIPSGNRKLATAYGLIQAQEIITAWLNNIT